MLIPVTQNTVTQIGRSITRMRQMRKIDFGEMCFASIGWADRSPWRCCPSRFGVARLEEDL